jgi:hypothetical protein
MMPAMRFAIVLALLALSRPSDACVPPNPETTTHEVDPAHSGDTVAPSKPDADYTIARTTIGGGCGGAKTDCDGKYATIYLHIDATDDATSTEKLGYDIKIIGGDTPKALYGRGFEGQGVVVQPRGDFEWSFDYDDTEFAFDVEIRAVDLNGNMSEPAVLHIAGDDRDDGCMSAAPAHSEWMLLPVLAFILRRRRLLDSTPCRKLRST